MFEKIIIVTRKTRLEELIARFNTKSQARFYIEHAGGNFAEYQDEHHCYERSLDTLRESLPKGMKIQYLDRSLVPTVIFSAQDLVVTLGQDGLVANTAKYIGAQPLIAVNPDPQRYDGILLPFVPAELSAVFDRTFSGNAAIREVTLAEATTNDGQRLLAFNDLFIGPRSHTSARYRIKHGAAEEVQSSSGIIVSTGAGSTGWLSSVLNMASGIAPFAGGRAGSAVRLAWEDSKLIYVVREPFASKHSQASMVAGWVEHEQLLIMESHMPPGGVVFSDGIESDFIAFNAGSILKTGIAATRAKLVVKETPQKAG